ncbi:Disintegrin and metalloproteinase domain-containing protein 8 [Anabarilius grahami]|uniref:Disintegrin and metalloproteinase domain-containing protein 8 n=1 Tax=Anabarilius grahami TaxID=495550 RepID=A0A3N0YV21_ANAGA|nr:Disintegrin and metalloproteinase domain-containing protein 8 [Anabarilius grahami]
MRYDVVRLRPQALKERARRSASSLKRYPEQLEYDLAVDGRNLTISLHRNRELLGKHYTLSHYTEDGISETKSSDNIDHCYYHGHIQDFENSSVSVGLCSGMEGFLRVNNQVYLIEPLEESLDGDHAVYKQEHLRTKQGAFGYINDTVYDLGPKSSGLYKGKIMKNKAPSGGQRIVEMVLVVDHTELYRPLNIRVMLVGLEVWSQRDLIDVSSVPNLTLERFFKWRQDSLLKRKKHDNAHFITAVDFDGSTVGLATMNAMCSPSSGAVNEDHNSNPIAVASTVAHEMGHNLGMSHDNPNCGCSSDTGCIMGDTIGYIYPDSFSTYSQSSLKAFLQNFDSSCLLDVPDQGELYGGPVCGNAFVEKGEECDCGTVELQHSGSLCRQSAHDCDLDEYCTGESAFCPEDEYKMNGLPCNHNQGYCFNGQCPTHKEHCKLLWGSDAEVDVDTCFRYNVFDRTSKSIEHMKCGKIYCYGRNPFPITLEKKIITFQSRTCNMAVDPSPTEDLGKVPSGTKCDTNKAMRHSVIIGVSASVVVLGLIIIIGALVCHRNKITEFRKKRSSKDIHTSSGQCNPAFQPGSAKNSPRCAPPRISQPTFLESSTSLTCKPLYSPATPCRPAPLEKPLLPPSKPLPPSRPLPPLVSKPVTKTKPPPVPPAKPTGIQPVFIPPQDLLKKIVVNTAGYIEPVLCSLREKIEEKRAGKQLDGTQDLEYYSTTNGQPRTVNHLMVFETTPATNRATVKITDKVRSAAAALGTNVDSSVRLLLEEKEQAILALQQTVERLDMFAQPKAWVCGVGACLSADQKRGEDLGTTFCTFKVSMK